MLNILFMGTPDFARDSLEAVYNAGHNILGVVTNPDRPKGRGMKLVASPVKEFAIEKNLKVFQPEKIKKNEEFISQIKDMNPDGIESNYIYIDKDNNEFDECEKWNRFAKNNNLFVTVGTDFHNSDGIRPEIGFVNKRIELTEDEIDKIIENLEK